MVIYKFQNIKFNIDNTFRSHSFCGIYEEICQMSKERRYSL